MAFTTNDGARLERIADAAEASVAAATAANTQATKTAADMKRLADAAEALLKRLTEGVEATVLDV